MPILSFETRFADAVANGEKTLTIRSERKHPISVGNRLHLFTGAYHTGQRRRLTPVEGVICVESSFIQIGWQTAATGKIYVNGHTLDQDQAWALMQSDGWVRDGKVRVSDFFLYFCKRPGDWFGGQIIRWKWWGEPVDATDPKIWKPEARHA